MAIRGQMEMHLQDFARCLGLAPLVQHYGPCCVNFFQSGQVNIGDEKVEQSLEVLGPRFSCCQVMSRGDGGYISHIRFERLEKSQSLCIRDLQNGGPTAQSAVMAE